MDLITPMMFFVTISLCCMLAMGFIMSIYVIRLDYKMERLQQALAKKETECSDDRCGL